MAKDNNEDLKDVLPKNKSRENSAENLLKRTYKRKFWQFELKTKVKKKHRGLKIASLVLTGGLAAFLVYNSALATIYNNDLPSGNPHTPENVIDPNDNDFEFNSNGQIETDTITQEEAGVLLDSFNDVLLTDATQRYGQDIGSVSEVISFNLLPYNLFEGSNEYDKYMLSILFKNDSDDIFALNYLTGKDFVSSSETSKDFFADYINYLQYECAIDNCEKITENLAFFENKLDEKVASEFTSVDDEKVVSKVTGVGNAYFGYRESGDECYFIPCYTANSEGCIYYSSSSSIDSYDKNAIEELKKWIINPQDENLNGVKFYSMPFVASENLQQVMSIFNEKLNVEQETDSVELN